MKSSFQRLRSRREYGPAANPELDLHDVQTDRIDAVEEFLDTQKKNGVSSVRIVTGHGSGELNRKVKDYLRSRLDVTQVEDSPNVLDASILVRLDLFR